MKTFDKILSYVFVGFISIVVWEVGHPYFLGSHDDHHHSHPSNEHVRDYKWLKRFPSGDFFNANK